MTLPYTLIYYGKGANPVDLTSSIEDIQKFTDVGSGEVVSARFTLDGRFGDFITQSNGGATPLISQHDLFRFGVSDDDRNTHARALVQDDISPQTNDQGAIVGLELFGREVYLQKMYFPGHFHFISFRDMVREIVNFWNTNKGTEQPTLTTPGTDLDDIPNYAFGVFNFGEKTTVYDALMDVVNRLALPTAAGGDGRQWGMTFSDSPAIGLRPGNSMLMRIRPVGSNSDIKTLPNAITISETLEPSKGNLVVVKGRPGSGSMPVNISVWRGLVEEYENIPPWDPTTVYRLGVYVRYQNQIYQTRVVHNSAGITPTFTGGWRTVSFADYVEAQTGNRNYQYSPWTNGMATVWKNRAGNAGFIPASNPNQRSGFFANSANPPAGSTGFNAICFTDHNLVIRDRNAWRDWVDCRVLSLDDIPTPYLYDAIPSHNTIQSRTYHGMRVLVDPKVDTSRQIGEPFDVPDKFGNSFENAMAMQDRDGDWIVIRNARQFDECAVWHEGKVYEFNEDPTDNNGKPVRHLVKSSSNAGLSWIDGSQFALGNDCFHYPISIANVEGLIGEANNSLISLDKTSSTRYTDDSAIRIDYEFVETDVVTQLVTQGLLALVFGDPIRLYNAVTGLFKAFTTPQLDFLHDVGLYNIGWWCPLWEAPDPKSRFNNQGFPVGAIFGGHTSDKRPVLDLLNLNHTPLGNTGYGHDDSFNLGEIDGIKFLLNFSVSGISIDGIRGDFPVRCFIYDLLGNVWVSDSTYRFLGFTEEMSFPLSTFRIYRARIQPAYTIGNFVSRAIDPELKITEIFERRLVKRIGFQFMFSYDDDGAYNFDTWEGLLRRVTNVAVGSTVRYSGTVDAFHFTKTPIAIAKDTTDPNNNVNQRHIMRDIIEYSDITNVVQLEKIARAELDRAKSQNDYFTVKIDDYVGVSAEDQVYIQNADLIPESESGDANTRRLIVKKVTYSIGDKRATSGLVSTIDLYRPIQRS